MSTPTISKSTGITISIALLISIVGLAYMVGSKTSGIETSGRQNSSDIAKILARMDARDERDAQFQTTMLGEIIAIKTKVESLTADSNKVSVAMPVPTRPVVVVASQGSAQPISQSSNQDQPPNSNQSPQPQSPDPPQQAQPLPCTLLPILCSQGGLL